MFYRRFLFSDICVTFLQIWQHSFECCLLNLKLQILLSKKVFNLGYNYKNDFYGVCFKKSFH